MNFLLQHEFWLAVATYWIFSAAVSAMPEPQSKDSPGYLWLYRFLHTMAGNITTALGSRIPGLKTLLLLLSVPLVLTVTACAVHYKVHPGAVNAADSAVYDTLLVAETMIQQARAGNEARPLPPDIKDELNVLVRSYNVTREAWLTYRGAVATNTPSEEYLKQLTKTLTDLTKAIETLIRKGVKP